MKFAIEKCALLIMKREKRETVEGIELPNEEMVRTLGKNENYKYLRILEADTMKQAEMKEKIRKDYLKRKRKLSSAAEILSKRQIPGQSLS